ncbi:MAG: SAM-dependent chlorinase/fluorinase [Bryobacteraceae bacterium]|nr:SAM-dependent chlorinase/fluorinase [Bryobacteraceae bacterium]
MAVKKTGRPVITLTTDFGVTDHYVGVMKGVIAGLCPDAQVVDISHDVPPFEIAQGAFLVAQAWPYFPKGTVHVAVVDPGVGTARRPILVEAHGQKFIGPDNGVLALVYAETEHKAREITNDKLFLPGVSRTFHGRDIFAPVAARIAAGARVSSVGPVIQDHLRLSAYKPSRTSKRLWTGSVLYVDRFGNLITNFHGSEFGDVKTRPFEVSIGTVKVHRMALTFADADPGEVVLVLGSSGYFEIAANQGSAAKLLGCGVGAPVDVELF